MKKILGLLIITVMSLNVAFADGVEVQATMQSRSNFQDRIWVGTFQLVWNDFMDKVVHNPVRFREGTPIIVQDLNRQKFKETEISEDSYYKTTKKITKNTKKQIVKAIKKKFGETSDLLDKMDLSEDKDKYLIYAMLKKEFEFNQAFDKLGESSFGDGKNAEFFGINKESDNILCQGVEVLFYNSHKDFAVKLQTRDNEDVYLYRNDANKAFNLLYSDMRKKQKLYGGEKSFRDIDELMVPNIRLFEEKSFEELVNKRVMGTNYVIAQAMETIKFNMDNSGVELKSEAGMSFATCSLPSPEELIPRQFYFNDTFVIFLKESNKRAPYFALRVNDISKFQ